MKFILNCILLCFITNEPNVLTEAQAENRPVAAVFLSPDCPWSTKLQHEVLQNTTFVEKVEQEAILWPIALKHNEEEKAFLQKYQVHNCPSILLLDPKGKEFARFEYVPTDAAGYAALIVEQINDFQEICIALDQNERSFNEEKWRDLYQKAKKLSASCYKQVLLDRGVRKEKGSFFHLEKFASLLEKYKIKHPLVRKAKKQLLERDPKNEQGYHFKVAVLEFQKLVSRIKPGERPETALRPLLKYIEAFGRKDRENYWKSEWMVAEFLYTKNIIDPALEHAYAAYAAAPDLEKPQIAETISFFQGGLNAMEQTGKR